MRYEGQISGQLPHYCAPLKYMNVWTGKLGQTFSPEDEVPAEKINKVTSKRRAILSFLFAQPRPEQTETV